MRKIYLVRHAQPDMGAEGRHLCLGRTDAALSPDGNRQAERLAPWFKGKNICAVYASPLTRCRKTAEILVKGSDCSGMKITYVGNFAEVDAGRWDGMDFTWLREMYPEEFEKRDRSPGRYVIPGGESLEMAGRRFWKAFFRLCGNTGAEDAKEGFPSVGDILIVAHAGVLQAFLSLLTGKDIDRLWEFYLPYASVTVLSQETKDGPFRIDVTGLRPLCCLCRSEAERIWKECGVSPQQREHMEMTADIAMDLIGYDQSKARSDRFDPSFAAGSSFIDTRKLYYAALLHDIRRCEGGRIHAEKAAEYLHYQGYLELEPLVRSHHDPSVYLPGEPLSEAELLFYADKRVLENRLVTLEERFESSRKKCRTPQALESHRAQYEAAKGIEGKLSAAVGSCQCLPGKQPRLSSG